MIVVEGPDGSGKTTLVANLLEEFPGLAVGTRGTKNRDLLYKVTLPDTMRALACMVQGHLPVRVWDRLFWSDFVYAPIQDRPVAFNEEHIAHVVGLIDLLKPPVILCLPPEDVVVQNILSDRHQMPGVKERAVEVYYRYVRLMSSHMLEGKFLLHDYTDPKSFDRVCLYIQHYLDRRSKRT